MRRIVHRQLLLIVLMISPAFAQVRFYRLEQDVITSRLKDMPLKDSERESTLKRLFAANGCDSSHLKEEAVKHAKNPNVMCVLNGNSDRVIVVGAHFDHVEQGSGAVDNWSGASLLPSLLQSLSQEKRSHTFIFIGFTDEERGMVGSRFYVNGLTPEERARIDAMINMDTLGLANTEVWQSHADARLVTIAAMVSNAMKLPLSAVNVDQVGSTDSESFREKKIPSITFHSLTQETLPILHSGKDQLPAVNLEHLYESYKLITAYLAYLDTAQIADNKR